jgi:hypothetical protein
MALHGTTWLIIAGLGIHALATRLGASTMWSILAGVSYPLSPFLLYWLAASWVNGAVGFAALPWALFFLAARRPSRLNAMGLAFATYIVGVSGWIHAIIPLTIFGAARVMAPDREIEFRDRLVFALSLASGALLASPQLLTTVAAVQGSMRASNISNNGTAVGSLQGITTSFWPTFAQPAYWFDRIVWPPPAYYSAWFVLPAALLVRNRSREILRTYGWLLLPAFFVLIATLGPSQLGPSRWPIRYLPGAWAALIPIAAAILSRYRTSDDLIPRRWIAAFLGLAALLSWQQQPDRMPLLLFLGLLLWGMSVLASQGISLATSRHKSIALLTGTLLIHGWMAADYPINSMFEDYMGPSRRSEIRRIGIENPASLVQIYRHSSAGEMRGKNADDASGEFTPWNTISRTKEEADYLPSGNMGLWRRERMLNGYTPIEMMNLKLMTCGQSIFGWTCDGPAPTLLAQERQTGRRFIDLMRIDAVVVSTRMPKSLSDFTTLEGWSQEPFSTFATVFRRDESKSYGHSTLSYLPPSASFVSAAIVTDDHERVVVERERGFAGGPLVFARAYYPGHVVSIDGQPAPIQRLGGILIAAQLPAGEGPVTVDIRYQLPMPVLWKVCVVLGLIALAGAAWAARRRGKVPVGARRQLA